MSIDLRNSIKSFDTSIENCFSFLFFCAYKATHNRRPGRIFWLRCSLWSDLNCDGLPATSRPDLLSPLGPRGPTLTRMHYIYIKKSQLLVIRSTTKFFPTVILLFGPYLISFPLTKFYSINTSSNHFYPLISTLLTL